MPAILEPLEGPVTEAASVPRRFGVGVLMILMTAFAVLFAGMQTFHARPEVFVIVAVLFTAVTLGQILLFQGKKPRQASLLVGAAIFPLEIFGLMLWTSRDTRDSLEFAIVFSLGVLIISIPGGTLFGYLAGCVMAGIFFVQEKLGRRSVQPLKLELLPCTAADFDTLIAWVHHESLFDLWSRGVFRYPLDHEQLTAHWKPTGGEPPNRLGFKAVCGEMQEMVGYAELAAINREDSPRSTWRSSIHCATIGVN